MHVSGSTEVAERLRNDILCGRIPEGARLAESGISKRFGVGRGPVREAVQKLSSQGLLQTRPNCGAVVAPEASREARGVLVPIRRTLEVHALTRIFDELGPDDFQRWEEILKQMHEACLAEDFHTIAEADIAFHHYLLVRSGEPDFLIVWETLIGRIRSHFRRTQRRCQNLLAIHEEHREILDAFRNGTLQEAVRLLKEKID